jgi:hypothetical protein
MFHVELRRGRFHAARLFNLEQAELLERIVEPWRRGAVVAIEGRRWPLRDTAVAIREGPRLSAEQLAMGRGWQEARRHTADVTSAWLTPRSAADDGDPRTTSGATVSKRHAVDRRAVAVLAGDDEAARQTLIPLLAGLGIAPRRLSVPLSGQQPPWLVIEQTMRESQAIVVVFSADDEARAAGSGERLSPQPRQSFLIAAGMAIGAYPERTVVVEFGTLGPIGELSGLRAVRLDRGAVSSRELAARLEEAGCVIDRSGVD